MFLGDFWEFSGKIQILILGIFENLSNFDCLGDFRENKNTSGVFQLRIPPFEQICP